MSELRDPVALAQRLVRFDSVTPDRSGALDFLQTALTSLGFSCQRLVFCESGTPDVDNLFARLGTTAPHLCFAGHTDVVPSGAPSSWMHPPFAAEIADGVLYGRGVSDMKGAIAAFVAAVAELGGITADRGSISLLITGDEEGPGINGTEKMLRWMQENGHVPDQAIVGEPTNPAEMGEMIKIGRRGSLNGTLTVTGKRGHVAYAHLATNPIPGLARAIDALARLRLDGGTMYFEPSTLAFTSLDGANPADNVIPDQVGAHFNIRYNDAHSAESLEKTLQAALRESLDGTGLEHKLDMRDQSAAFFTTPGPAIEIFEQVVSEVTGRQPMRSTTGGTSDARFIRRFCPVFEFGLISESIHKIDERARVADIVTLKTIYAAFIRRYLGF